MATSSPELIVLMTDYGLVDPYVGIMKGVIAGIAPATRVIDLTHDIQPGNIRQGAIILRESYEYFPKRTIFVGIVDPGVGSNRRPILISSMEHFFIGPDNGLFSYVHRNNFITRELVNPLYHQEQISTTFHGRDIFATAAAHLAAGVSQDNFGPIIEPIIRIPFPHLALVSRNTLEGEILFTDRFGNISTSICARRVAAGKIGLFDWENKEIIMGNRAQIALHLPSGKILRMVSTFRDLASGDCGILLNSGGLIEIVANQASAKEILGLEPGVRILLKINSSN